MEGKTIMTKFGIPKRRGREAKAGTKRLLGFMKKGYDIDGTISMSKTEAKVRVKELHQSGYKARAVKGNYELYGVAREPYNPHKSRNKK
jgi:hypothetical protein